MARFVELAAGSGVRLYMNEIPLYYLGDSLLGPRWNLFAEEPGLLKAIKVWYTTSLLVAGEYLVSKDHVDDGFHGLFWDWWKVYYFPAGILTPILPSIYYVERIRSDMGTELELWDYVSRAEYTQLFIAVWLQEAERGKGGSITAEGMRSWLEDKPGPDHVVDLETSNGQKVKCKTLSLVLEPMSKARESSPLHCRWFRYVTPHSPCHILYASYMVPRMWKKMRHRVFHRFAARSQVDLKLTSTISERQTTRVYVYTQDRW